MLRGVKKAGQALWENSIVALKLYDLELGSRTSGKQPRKSFDEEAAVDLLIRK